MSPVLEKERFYDSLDNVRFKSCYFTWLGTSHWSKCPAITFSVWTLIFSFIIVIIIIITIIIIIVVVIIAFFILNLSKMLKFAATHLPQNDNENKVSAF